MNMSNTFAMSNEDTRVLLNLIETKGREIAEAMRTLRGVTRLRACGCKAPNQAILCKFFLPGRHSRRMIYQPGRLLNRHTSVRYPGSCAPRGQPCSRWKVFLRFAQNPPRNGIDISAGPLHRRRGTSTTGECSANRKEPDRENCHVQIYYKLPPCKPL